MSVINKGPTVPFLNKASGFVSGFAFINGRGMTRLLDSTCLQENKHHHYYQLSLSLFQICLLTLHDQLNDAPKGYKRLQQKITKAQIRHRRKSHMSSGLP